MQEISALVEELQAIGEELGRQREELDHAERSNRMLAQGRTAVNQGAVTHPCTFWYVKRSTSSRIVTMAPMPMTANASVHTQTL